MRPTEIKLFAANGAAINTYGEKIITLDLGLRRPFVWKFVILDVSQPVIGADLLQNFGLTVDLKGKRLSDSTTLISAPAGLVRSTTPSVYTVATDANCCKLLRKFPAVTAPTQVLRMEVLHHIITEGLPVSQPPRRLPPERLRMGKQEFQYMMEQGICRPSSSLWTSPLHLVVKKDGTLRPCGDYRRLNAVTIPNRAFVRLGFFVLDNEETTNPQIFVEKFREHMRQLKPSPTAHHRKRKPFVHRSLYDTDHVFVRVDRVSRTSIRKPLEHPYEGPFKVINRTSDELFTIDIHGKKVNINIARLKPAFLVAAEFDNTINDTTAPNQPEAGQRYFVITDRNFTDGEVTSRGAIWGRIHIYEHTYLYPCRVAPIKNAPSNV